MSSPSPSPSLCKVKLGGTLSWQAFFQPLLFKCGDLQQYGMEVLEELEIVTPPPRKEENALLAHDEDWRSLAEFVGASTALRELTLSTARPDDEKLTVLLQALRDNTSLQECSLRLDGIPVRQEELAYFCWRNRLQARLAKVPVAPERILSHGLHKAMRESAACCADDKNDISGVF